MNHSVVRFAVAVALAFAFTTTATLQQPVRHWVAAWSTSQQALSSTTITNRTIRMLARVTVGGDTVRIRLDNAFGTTPVTVGRAFVGVQRVTRSGDSSSRSASLLGGSNRPLLFKGAATVAIPAGGTVTSDPVSMTVLAQQDLAVSLYVPGSEVHASAHTSAQTRSYLTANSAGDYSADEGKAAFTSSTTSTFWLKAIEVLSASRGAIALLGDSITDGTCSTLDGHDRWADELARRLNAADAAANRAVINEGIGGNTLTTIRTNSAVERLDRDVLSHAGVSDVILLSGINDINKGAGATPIISGYQEVIARVKARGARIIGATLIPRQDVAPSGTWTPAKSDVRNAINGWIRTSGAFDAVLDFDAAVRDPARLAFIRPQFDCDAVHPTPLGHYLMGTAIPLDLFEQP
jgi:lysophospholipase L1-like esterase